MHTRDRKTRAHVARASYTTDTWASAGPATTAEILVDGPAATGTAETLAAPDACSLDMRVGDGPAAAIAALLALKAAAISVSGATASDSGRCCQPVLRGQGGMARMLGVLPSKQGGAAAPTCAAHTTPTPVHHRRQQKRQRVAGKGGPAQATHSRTVAALGGAVHARHTHCARGGAGRCGLGDRGTGRVHGDSGVGGNEQGAHLTLRCYSPATRQRQRRQ